MIKKKNYQKIIFFYCLFLLKFKIINQIQEKKKIYKKKKLKIILKYLLLYKYKFLFILLLVQFFQFLNLQKKIKFFFFVKVNFISKSAIKYLLKNSNLKNFLKKKFTSFSFINNLLIFKKHKILKKNLIKLQMIQDLQRLIMAPNFRNKWKVIRNFKKPLKITLHFTNKLKIIKILKKYYFFLKFRTKFLNNKIIKEKKQILFKQILLQGHRFITRKFKKQLIKKYRSLRVPEIKITRHEYKIRNFLEKSPRKFPNYFKKKKIYHYKTTDLKKKKFHYSKTTSFKKRNSYNNYFFPGVLKKKKIHYSKTTSFKKRNLSNNYFFSAILKKKKKLTSKRTSLSFEQGFDSIYRPSIKWLRVNFYYRFIHKFWRYFYFRVFYSNKKYRRFRKRKLINRIYNLCCLIKLVGTLSKSFFYKIIQKFLFLQYNSFSKEKKLKRIVLTCGIEKSRCYGQYYKRKKIKLFQLLNLKYKLKQSSHSILRKKKKLIKFPLLLHFPILYRSKYSYMYSLANAFKMLFKKRKQMFPFISLKKFVKLFKYSSYSLKYVIFSEFMNELLGPQQKILPTILIGRNFYRYHNYVGKKKFNITYRTFLLKIIKRPFRRFKKRFRPSKFITSRAYVKYFFNLLFTRWDHQRIINNNKNYLKSKNIVTNTKYRKKSIFLHSKLNFIYHFFKNKYKKFMSKYKRKKYKFYTSNFFSTLFLLKIQYKRRNKFKRRWYYRRRLKRPLKQHERVVKYFIHGSHIKRNIFSLKKSWEIFKNYQIIYYFRSKYQYEQYKQYRKYRKYRKYNKKSKLYQLYVKYKDYACFNESYKILNKSMHFLRAMLQYFLKNKFFTRLKKNARKTRFRMRLKIFRGLYSKTSAFVMQRIFIFRNVFAPFFIEFYFRQVSLTNSVVSLLYKYYKKYKLNFINHLNYKYKNNIIKFFFKFFIKMRYTDDKKLLTYKTYFKSFLYLRKIFLYYFGNFRKISFFWALQNFYKKPLLHLKKKLFNRFNAFIYTFEYKLSNFFSRTYRFSSRVLAKKIVSTYGLFVNNNLIKNAKYLVKISDILEIDSYLLVRYKKFFLMTIFWRKKVFWNISYSTILEYTTLVSYVTNIKSFNFFTYPHLRGFSKFFLKLFIISCIRKNSLYI